MENCLFEMKDSAAKTMSKFQKIVIDFCSNSETSEKLDKRQQNKLKELKTKEHKRGKEEEV